MLTNGEIEKRKKKVNISLRGCLKNNKKNNIPTRRKAGEVHFPKGNQPQPYSPNLFKNRDLAAKLCWLNYARCGARPWLCLLQHARCGAASQGQMHSQANSDCLRSFYGMRQTGSGLNAENYN